MPYWFLVLVSGSLAMALPTAVASTIHPPQPIRRDDLPSRRAGNDRVAGPGVDREVTSRDVAAGAAMAVQVTRSRFDFGMLQDEV